MMLLVAVVAAASSLPASAQSASALFQQGLRREQIDGDLKGAITIYQRILKEHSESRSLSAAVLMQLAGAYEKQGNDAARVTYQRVIREYPDQVSQVGHAEARLVALAPVSAPDHGEGPTLRRVWTDASGSGTVTADGRFIAFADRNTGRLGVRDIAKNQNRLLTEEPQRPWQEYALGAAPSRNSKDVAYAWFAAGRPVELRVMPMTGGAPRTLYTNPQVEFIAPFDWSPDGREILAFLGRKDHVGQIALVSAVDGTVRTLKTLGWRAHSGRMGLSPDGKFIAYNFAPGDDVEQRDIFILATDASSEWTFVSGADDDRFLAWTPDGKHLLYTSGPPGQARILLATVERGKPAGTPVLLTRAAGDLQTMGITNGGAFIYAAQTPAPIRVYAAVLDSTTKAPTPLQVAQTESWAAQWSHDGKTLAYASNARPDQSRPTHLIVRSIVNGAERVVPAADLAYAYSTRWSPDDRYLMVVGQDKKGRRGVFRVDPASGVTSLVIPAAAGADEVFAGWSADGKSVFYSENTRRDGRIAGVVFRKDLEGEGNVELVRLNGMSVSRPRISPDGSRIAFSSREAGDSSAEVLRVISVGGGEPTVVLRPTLFDIGPFDWSTDARALFFVAISRTDKTASGPNTRRVMRVSAEGGEPVNTGIVLPFAAISVQAHPAGDTMMLTMWSTTPGQRDVWAMENFLPKQRPGSTSTR
jgi:Tol biopolymer transport system component